MLNCLIWSARVRGPLLALVIPSSILAGCVTSDPQGGTRAASGDVVAQVREIDLSARYPRRVGTADTSPNIGPQAQSYFGDGTPATVEVPPADHGTEDPPTTGTTFGHKTIPTTGRMSSISRILRSPRWPKRFWATFWGWLFNRSRAYRGQVSLSWPSGAEKGYPFRAGKRCGSAMWHRA